MSPGVPFIVSQFTYILAMEIKNIGESTRIDIHKYQCERCVFNSSSMDELLMHVNTKHRADDVDDAERSSNNPN